MFAKFIFSLALALIGPAVRAAPCALPIRASTTRLGDPSKVLGFTFQKNVKLPIPDGDTNVASYEALFQDGKLIMTWGTSLRGSPLYEAKTQGYNEAHPSCRITFLAGGSFN